MEKTQYLSHDTIHALATPVGGALSIVRLSGPLAIQALERLMGTDAELLRKREPREIFRSKLWGAVGRGAEAEVIDDAMAVFYRGPKSQTGEDLVEFFLHGGNVVAERVLCALEDAGSRQALPGEFSFRAVRNGKLSIAEAEAVADLIAAANEGGARLALEKMAGLQSRHLAALAEGLRKVATMAELGIDFADQDVEELSLPVLKTRVREVLGALNRLEASFDRGNKIQSGIQAAFVGRPNAGKSSLFNALLGEDRSIVSEIAGTTRDVVRERVTLRSERGAITLRLEDTAGIRTSSGDRIEREGIERSVRSAHTADLVMLVGEADASDEAWRETMAVWDAIGRPKEKALGILTKRDRADEGAVARNFTRLETLGISVVGVVSSVTGEGIPDAACEIARQAARYTHRAPGEVLLTRMDHLRSVRETVTHLERSLTVDENDLFAADLRQALIELGPVIGETLPDDILGRIFSEFCIGK